MNHSKLFLLIADAGLLFSYCALLYWLSEQKQQPVPIWFDHQDKLLHFGAYFVLGVLIWRCLKNFLNNPSGIAIFGLLLCSMYGLFDEWHQSFVPGRQANLADWFADTSGATASILLLFRLHKIYSSAKIRGTY